MSEIETKATKKKFGPQPGGAAARAGFAVDPIKQNARQQAKVVQKNTDEAPPLTSILKWKMGNAADAIEQKAIEKAKQQTQENPLSEIEKAQARRILREQAQAALQQQAEEKVQARRAKAAAEEQGRQEQNTPVAFVTRIIDNTNLQNPNQPEALANIQEELTTSIKENKLADPDKVEQYLKSQASQDRQEVMKDSKLPFKDKIYSLAQKMSEALHMPLLSNYCQKKLQERAAQRQGVEIMKNRFEKLTNSTQPANKSANPKKPVTKHNNKEYSRY